MGENGWMVVPAVDDVNAVVWRYRLVFVGAEGYGPRAFVYPADANAYTTPLGYFDLVPFQELPRCESGSLFEFASSFVNDSRVSATGPDGTVVRSSGQSKLTNDDIGRIYAERDSSVLVHPSVTGATPSWRHASSSSPLTVQERERHVEHERRQATKWIALAAVVLVVSIVLIVVLIVTDMAAISRVPARQGLLAGLALAGGIAALRRARRALRVLAEARQAYGGPLSSSFARVWWSVGNGWGPVAMVTLARTPDPSPDAIIGHQPVVNVRLDTSVPDWSPAQVSGEIVDRQSVVVRCGDLELWPADSLMTTLPSE